MPTTTAARRRLFSQLADRTLLLVLDNLEQLVGRGRTSSNALLDGVPALTVVATSRRPLHVSGEHEHAVPPLTAAGGPTLQTAEERRRRCNCSVSMRSVVRSGLHADARTTSADVVAICRRLDGLPLAIELTAARSRLLAPPPYSAGCRRYLETESTDVTRPARQRSLRDTIAWSQDLLDSDQQEFFRRLGAFQGQPTSTPSLR